MAIDPDISFDWNLVVRRDGPKLFRYFRSRFDHQQAADLVQEVFLRLVRKRQNLAMHPGSAQFTAYALGVAHFVGREAFKKHTRLKENLVSDYASFEKISSIAGHIEHDCSLEQDQHSEILRKAMRTLPLLSQEILSLLVERDLSLQDIASIVGMPLNTVKSHIHRAKEKLKIELKKMQKASSLEG